MMNTLTKFTIISTRLLIVFCLLYITTTSCRNNDDEKIETPIPADKRYLSSVSDQDGKTILKVEYYADKKFKKFNFPEGGFEYRYVYDADGRIAAFKFDGKTIRLSTMLPKIHILSII